MRSVSCAVLVAMVLAGCMTPGDKAEQEGCEDLALCDLEEHYAQHHCVQNDVQPRIYAPDSPSPGQEPDPWQEGDYWTFRLTVDGQTIGETKLIYYDTQDGGAHYMVGVPDWDEALRHAVFSVNPVIGRVHKVLYSPHESGAHADMFHFPLCEGSTWSDTYFATPFTFTAHQKAIELPGGQSDPLGFEITGTASDGSTIRHTYSPAVKWFTQVDLDRADGVEVNLALVDHGSDATGDAYFLRGQKDEVIAIAPTPTGRQVEFEREAGSDGDYDLLGANLDLRREAGQGKVEMWLIDPGGERLACVGIEGNGLNGATDCPAPPLLLDVPWQAGTWSLSLEVAPLSTDTRASAEVAIASIYDRSGTV